MLLNILNNDITIKCKGLFQKSKKRNIATKTLNLQDIQRTYFQCINFCENLVNLSFGG